MKKRVLSLVLALLVCALIPAAGAAEYKVTEVIPFQYDDVGDFSEGLAPVKLNGKWGYIDKTGKVVIPYKYDFAYHFSEGLAPVKLNDKWGYIDKTGKVVIPSKYDYAYHFHEGLARVYMNGKYGFIDKTGKEIVPCKYSDAYAFSEGLAPVKLNGKWGYIDKTGEEVIPCKYDGGGNFSEGLATVKLNGKWGFIDKTGKEVIPFQYQCAGSFSEGLAYVGKRDYDAIEKIMYGYIDKTGKEVIPIKNDGLEEDYSFRDGLAVAWGYGGYGFIDKTGKTVIPCKYDGNRDNFFDGLAKVLFRGDSNQVSSWAFIDKTGQEVVPFGKYHDAHNFSEGFAAVLQDSGKYDGRYPIYKWGFLAIDGYVPLELDQGNGVDYIIADSSSILNVPTNPTKEGYTFGGWYTDAALTTPWNFNHKVVNTLTLYAKWVPVSSTATTTGKSQSVISLNGSAVTLDAYTLKAANGGDVTYVKLRDIAALLENTNAKFNVDWRRGAIYVASKSAYTTKNGTELKAISGTDGSYKWNQAPVLFDGTTKALEGIVITDGKGGGHTFFKLRDLGEAIGFTVGWTAQRGIFIETK